MADIPGIIEGAHEGKGLGHRFLKHIERNALLLLLIPSDSKNHLAEYKTLINELEAFSSELIFKDKIVAISKSEMLDNELKEEIRREMAGIDLLFISSVAQQGLIDLKDEIWKRLN